VLHDGPRTLGLIGRAPLLPPRLVKDVCRRALLAWVGVHLFLTVVQIIFYPPLLSPVVVGLVVLIVLTDIRVCRETVLFANLGLSRNRSAAMAILPATLLEIIWFLVTVPLVA
jgi:hypothetical protein